MAYDWIAGCARGYRLVMDLSGKEEVRWRAAGHHRSRSFMNWALADGYRADLVRAAHRGTGFDPGHR